IGAVDFDDFEGILVAVAVPADVQDRAVRPFAQVPEHLEGADLFRHELFPAKAWLPVCEAIITDTDFQGEAATRFPSGFPLPRIVYACVACGAFVAGGHARGRAPTRH